METYRPKPFFKRIFLDVKIRIQEKIKNFKFPWKKLIIFGLFILIILAIYLLVLIKRVNVSPRAPYDKTDFIKAEAYIQEHGNETILENTNFKFILYNKDTSFSLHDKASNKTYLSNPNSKYVDTFKVYYAGSLGAATEMGVYDNAIVQKDYLFRLKDNSLEVLYLIGGKKEVDKTDFPALIDDARMQELILSKLDEKSTAYKRVTQVYVFGELNGKPVWRFQEGIQTSILKQLYKIFYEDCAYTVEDLQYDLQLHNIVYEDLYPYIELAARYTLTNEGLEFELVNDALVEKEIYPLVYIDVLPYFAASGLDDSGYTVICDGSGILIDFNNERSFALRYNQRIYGKELAKKQEFMAPSSEDIKLPLYGMKINDSGFINVIEEGAEMTSIIASISSSTTPYNQTFYRYHIREGETFTFDSISNSTVIFKWTEFYNTVDLKFKIIMVDEDEGSYSAMAKKYQDYLVKEEILKDLDTTRGVVLDLSFLGGYLVKENFLGFPYTTVRSLTKPEEVLAIVDEFISDGVTDINVIYEGFSNNGIKPTYMGNISYNYNNGTKSEFRILQDKLLEKNINFYLGVYVNTAYTKKSLNNNDLVRDVFGKIVTRYNFNEALLYPDYSTMDYYTLEPKTFNQTLTNIYKHFNASGYQNISFKDFGSNTYGSYSKNNPVLRTDTVKLFADALNGFNGKNLMFNKPNLYSLKYANKLGELATYGTNYQIIATSIPFYQLVLSGYLDYSPYSINIDDKYSITWHKMKAIETLSNLSMTLSFASTINLVETEYSNYYSTYYKNWYDTLVELYFELNSLGIYNSKLMAHELLNSNGNITKASYANGIEIVFNYSNSNYKYKEYTIEKNSYKVVREVD